MQELANFARDPSFARPHTGFSASGQKAAAGTVIAHKMSNVAASFTALLLLRANIIAHRACLEKRL